MKMRSVTLITVGASILMTLCAHAARAQPCLPRVDAIADGLLRANGRTLRGHVVASVIGSWGWAAITPPDLNGAVTVYIHPQHACDSNNQLAFVLGHELAHQLDSIGTGPENEMKADVRGAQMAANAGWNVNVYADEILSRPDQCDPSHGCLHARVMNVLRAVREGTRQRPLRCFQGCPAPSEDKSPGRTNPPTPPMNLRQSPAPVVPDPNDQLRQLFWYMEQYPRVLQRQLQADQLLLFQNLYGGY
jgi:hypothetical protein